MVLCKANLAKFNFCIHKQNDNTKTTYYKDNKHKMKLKSSVIAFPLRLSNTLGLWLKV